MSGRKQISNTFTVNALQDGERGKIGRFPYFAGVWEEIGSSQSFYVTDAQAPFFEYTLSGQKRYAVFNPEQNGSYTKAQMLPQVEDSSDNLMKPDVNTSGTPWRTMVNDFEYLITKAVFAQFAQFGGAIINDEWMMSKYGVIYNSNGVATTIDSSASVTIDGTTYTYNNAYLLFDADYPNEHKPSSVNFTPNYALNLVTGKTYQNDAYIKGEIHATSGFFENVTVADSILLHKVTRLNVQSSNSGSAFVYDLYDYVNKTIKGNIVLLTGYGNTPQDLQYPPNCYTLNLPPAELFPKAMIRIVNGTMNNQGTSGSREPMPITVKLAVKFDGTGIPAEEDAYLVVTNAMYAGIPFYAAGVGNPKYLLQVDHYTNIMYNLYVNVDIVSVEVPYGVNHTPCMDDSRRTRII